jgi:hypothetical protein
MVNVQKGVQFVRKEIVNKKKQWTVIRDCLEGEQKIKDKGQVYLPYPSTSKPDCDNVEDNRYKAYKDRAVFLNVTRRTLYELMAQVFIKEPVVDSVDNDLIKYMIENATGNGVSLNQCAKQSLNYALAYAYGGVFVDFPETKGAVSLADFEKGGYRPTITPYSPFDIKNFRVEDVGAEERLTLVVLGENYFEVDADGFEVKERKQLRVLRLADGVYKQVIYRSSTDDGFATVDDFKEYKTIIPTDANGQTLDYIPFFFIGMENNNPYPDNPILYDLASLNIAHYRNSADYENTMFIAGQATLFVSGLNGNKSMTVGSTETPAIKLGSENAINLNNGGTAGLLQAKADSGLAESMEKKEKQMSAFGAKFLDSDNVAKTAYQVKVENPSQGSILANCADNVSDAYTKALKVAHKLCGLDDSNVLFELNTDFEYNRVGSDEQNFFINAWTQGAISFTEMRECLKRGGSATQDNEVAKKEIDEERAKAQQEQIELAKQQSALNQAKEVKGAKNETKTQN